MCVYVYNMYINTYTGTPLATSTGSMYGSFQFQVLRLEVKRIKKIYVNKNLCKQNWYETKILRNIGMKQRFWVWLMALTHV